MQRASITPYTMPWPHPRHDTCMPTISRERSLHDMPTNTSRAARPASAQRGAHHHSLKDIARYIERSALSRAGRSARWHLFETLAQAEAAIHEVPIERIHLHEVGALDSIIDIVGAVFGMEWLGADERRRLAAQRRERNGLVRAWRVSRARRRPPRGCSLACRSMPERWRASSSRRPARC